MRWVAGFFFAGRATRNDSGSVESAPLPNLPPGPNTFRTLSRVEAQTYAGFGQVTYTLWEKFDLIGGIRLTLDDRQVERTRQLENGLLPGPQVLSSYTADDDFSSVQPKIGLSYRFTPEIEVYGSVAAGYQSGGFNTSNDNVDQAKFNPARSWHYEVGVKTAWLERKLLVDFTVFYIETDGYQVYRLGQLDPSQAYLVNADRASSLGAELEVTALPVEGLEVSANIGCTDARYESYTDPVTGANFDDNQISFVPEFTASGSVTYRFPFGLYITGEVLGVGRYQLDEANTAQQDAYALLNARLGYQARNWEVAVFARNIFDEEYVNNALDLRNAFQPDLLVLQPGDPLTYGFAVTARF